MVRFLACQDLIRRCLSLNPDDRPAFEQILEHPWITAGDPIISSLSKLGAQAGGSQKLISTRQKGDHAPFPPVSGSNLVMAVSNSKATLNIPSSQTFLGVQKTTVPSLATTGIGSAGSSQCSSASSTHSTSDMSICGSV